MHSFISNTLLKARGALSTQNTSPLHKPRHVIDGRRLSGDSRQRCGIFSSFYFAGVVAVIVCFNFMICNGSPSHSHRHRILDPHAHITLIFFATSVVVAVSCVKIITIVKHHHIAADSSPCLDAITAGVIFSFQVAEMRRYFYVLNLASSGRMIESLQELSWQNHLPKVTTGIVAMLVA